MDEYIRKEVLIETIENIDWYKVNAEGKLELGAASADEALYKAKDIFKALAEIPVLASTAEVKHGKWIERSDRGVIQMTHPYVCNRCGRVEMVKEPYCNCGAKMDM